MALSKTIKRLSIFLLSLLLLIIVAAVAIPYFFKDEILERVKTDINKNLNAKVDFADVDLSLLRSFPDFSFNMKSLEVVGIDAFEGIQLVAAEEVDLSLDLMSVIKSDRPIEVHRVLLDKPVINIITLPNGRSNYDITKGPATETEESTTEYSFLVQLQEYAINEGYIKYDDRLGNMFVELKDLNHSGSGDFTQDVFDLVTKTDIGSFTTTYEGISYLNKVKTDLDMTLQADLKNMKFTLKDNELRLNAMQLKADGFVQTEWDKVNMDLTFSTPMNQFKNLLSLIPSAFTKDFSDVKANGLFTFNGYVKGTYDMEKGTYPPFKFDLSIDKGDFQYPDLPMAINGINTKVSINSPASDFDRMTIDVPIFKMNMGNNPFEAKLNLRTPISDPNIDTKIKGVIDLADLSKAFPMEGVQELSGVIDADMTAKAKMSDIEREAYESVDMKGDLKITGINYTAEGLPPVKIKTLHMGLTPKQAEIDEFDALLGKSDIKANGSIDNILAYLSPEKTMKGTFTVRSEYFNADEWVPAENSETEAQSATVEAEPVEVFDRFDFRVDAKVGKIKYDIYELTGNALVGRMNSNDLTIKDFRTKIGNSDLKGKGKITNVMNYVFKNETLYGDLQLFSDYFDLNQFMVETDESATAVNTANEEELEPIVVPDHIDMKIDANFGKLTYTNIDLKNINGRLVVKDQAVQIKDTKADMLGGRINMNGGYDTKEAEKPLFDMSYNIERFGFRDVFEKFVTVQKLAPIAKYLEGKFNTTMSFKGVLGQDMMPNLSSLSADGFLYTFDGALRNFKPLEKLSGLLDIKALQSMKIKDTKNWFEVKEGKVIVKDFDYSYQGIDMIIGGSHGIDQSMDYRIMAKIPRKMLKNNIGKAANKGLDLLNGQASKIGLNIADAEFINVQINLGGSITDPSVKLKPTGTDGEGFEDQAKQALEEVKDQVVDSVKTVVNDATEEVKAEVKKETDKVVTEVKDKGKEAIDSLLTNPGGAKETIKDVVSDASNPDSLKNNIKDKSEDLKESAKEGVNKLKGLFGKKKKKN